MRVRCPNCGVTHTVEEKKKRTVDFESKLKSAALAMAPIHQPAVTREAPAGLPSMDTHVRIPLRQAMISGLLDAPIGFVIGAGSGLLLAVIIDITPVNIAFTGYGLAAISGGGGLVGGLIAFCRTAKKEWPERLGIYDNLLWRIEDLTGWDLDGDNEIGEPGSPRVDIEFQEKGIPRETETLDIDLPRLTVLAGLIVLDGKSFSERTAGEAGISREEWLPLRDKLIDRRWAKWNHPTETKQGVSLQPKGKAILRSILGGDEGQKSLLGTHPRTPTNGNGNNYERLEYIERR